METPVVDRFDEKAAELLPCKWDCYPNPIQDHNPTCPAYYRPAVAAALRAQGVEIAQLKVQLAEANENMEKFMQNAQDWKEEMLVAELDAEKRGAVNANRAIQELLELCSMFEWDEAWIARFQKIQDEWKDR